MRKLYIYCGVVFCLAAICFAFLTVQPKLFRYNPSDITPESEYKKNIPFLTKGDGDDTENEVTVPETCPEKLADAIRINSDVYAWLTVPGTDIDYPVAQSPEKDSYYLRRDIYKQNSATGTIMSEHTYNGTDFEDPVTVLYGHCMRSGAMFGGLQELYSSKDGLEEYNTVEIYTEDKKLEYEVFAAVPYDTRHILRNYDFTDRGVYLSFFESIYSIRAFNAGAISEKAPEYGDKVLILSTCMTGDSSARYLVFAKLK